MTEYQRYRDTANIDGGNPLYFFDVPVRVTNASGGLIYLGNAGNGPYSYLQYNPSSVIIDTAGKELSERYGVFVPRKRFHGSGVYHDRVTWNVPLLPDYRVYFNSDDALFVRVEILGNRPRLRLGGIPVRMHDTLGSASFPTQSLMPRLPNDERSRLCLEAFNYFNDVFPETLPVGEFVQGFTQLKDLMPKIEKSIAKTISGGYLNEKFGWENLLTDLEALGGLFDETISRMDYLRRTYGKPQRMGFSRPNCWTPDESLDSFSEAYKVYPPDSAFGSRVILQSYQCDFRATCKIYQTLDYIDGFTGFLRVMAGQLGLNNPVKTVWNMLPMSFVVDWFFNVSAQLDNLTRLDPAEGWNVYDITHSLTYRAGYSVQPAGYDESVYYWVFDPGFNPLGTATRQLYHRFVGLSIDLDALNPDNLSPNELALLFALLHQLG